MQGYKENCLTDLNEGLRLNSLDVIIIVTGHPAPLNDVTHGRTFFMAKQVKNPITFAKQVNLLKSRGCIIDDDVFCQKKLQLINYYRLSAYFLPSV